MSFVDDFPLLPEELEGPTPEEDVAAAAASVEDALNPTEADPGAPEPFGKTPLFDFGTGRYIRTGGSPAWVTGFDALQQWCLMAIYSARYAHAVFTEDFGMEEPDSILGEAADVDEAASDWGSRLQDALLVHDRISSVEDFNAQYDPTEGIMYINGFSVVTDEGDAIEFGDLEVPVGVTDG